MPIVTTIMNAEVWRRVGKKVYAGDVLVMTCSTRREAFHTVSRHNKMLLKGQV